MNTLQVLYQSDDNYAIFMGVSICSLFENNRHLDKIVVYVIDDGISVDNRNKILDMAFRYNREIVFVTGDKILNNPEVRNVFEYEGMRKNTHSYLKIFFDILLSEISGRLLYIDCDTAVMGSLSDLISIDMKGKTIGMVRDSLITNSKKMIGLSADDEYYNSGVILIDVEKWKENRCAERLLNHIKNIRSYGTVDQDVLNVELKSEIVTLPVKYNLQPVHLEYNYKLYSSVYKHKEKYYSEREIGEAVKYPVIVHYLRYIGESPWNAENVHPGTKYFDKYLELSPWRGYVKKAACRGRIFKIEKWMYKYLPKSVFLYIFFVTHENMIKKSNSIKGKGHG